jgi:hypothetical protein
MWAMTRSGVDVEYDAICASCLYVKADLRPSSMPPVGDRVRDRARPSGGAGSGGDDGDAIFGDIARRCAPSSSLRFGTRL